MNEDLKAAQQIGKIVYIVETGEREKKKTLFAIFCKKNMKETAKPKQ